MNAWVPNEQAVIRFKQRINYPAIVQHIEDNRKVLMDWPRVLKKINISSTSIWESYNLSSSIHNKNQAVTFGFFENGKKKSRIEVRVFTGLSNQAVIEKAVLLTGYTSMHEINMEYSKSGPGDFYLYSEHGGESAGDDSAICVFKNIIIEISTLKNDVDVRLIVKNLVDLMSNSLVENNKVPEISYHILQSTQDVKTGDTFWADIQFSSGNYPDDYDVDLLTTPIPKGLKYVENDESKYFLKANQPGTYQFEMWVMDRRTLITNTATFQVIVKD